ncbi:molybdopterin converting factor subunit 1 [Nannocystis pusilla]|uniref:molybdopterin converting factor subunit 1 n=1 Tax=Nannocystis pusilla TaxID=889268 RepID=UPI003DA3B55D
MHLRVLLFAGLRERLRRDSVDLELPAGARVRDLLATLAREQPDLSASLSVCRVAVDQEFVAADHVIAEGSEVAVIPPVSGGHDGPAAYQLIKDRPLALANVVAAVAHAGAGGIDIFVGNVRDKSRGHDIARLEYEAYEPMALRVMQRIGAAVEAETPGVRVAIHHRLGVLQIGESAVIVAASAPHRAEAFAACRAAIEQLKQDVPIWKREVATDGHAWVVQGP